MNILCVCGNGIGTSVLLKINVESAAADLDMDVTVTTSDAGSAKGTANMNDLVLTSAELAPELEGTTTPVEVVNNFMDTDEITTILEKYAD
ncbi:MULTISPECIES: PTS sugar transporter subunit IIB [Bifidobacterium]|jgi:PTS system ascorbate-specific IIB component|uniref:PTS sugar transporter subunit IIB n=1 Tax=Bifidobacterium tibiigranuli TaxID=2172043 RepID=A0A5N6RZI0_9BIFI|nr:PTS sugar transporter subunit IIB [Bifidobacterium tibiigranuli]KAE8127412.1 PTS sugar transporter subunit IIB [Bifidobacterium tibiigranuli]KAE8127856.1 PTS ascorbate transporter subunit IIB [Bifidobacterium tibiigranuli]MCI1210878.1 PTS sugar transporter subunit IIB [Bifidobacterium tibiigranuli]MCI1220555.1 PTS sugar transporter subunit IIB [Bifidobacterium tibiigranuli]MCI1232439.1 PTS sugar transporter subunit IIB [Bifidobacterium tibiigranuli]